MELSEGKQSSFSGPGSPVSVPAAPPRLPQIAPSNRFLGSPVHLADGALEQQEDGGLFSQKFLSYLNQPDVNELPPENPYDSPSAYALMISERAAEEEEHKRRTTSTGASSSTDCADPSLSIDLERPAPPEWGLDGECLDICRTRLLTPDNYYVDIHKNPNNSSSSTSASESEGPTRAAGPSSDSQGSRSSTKQHQRRNNPGQKPATRETIEQQQKEREEEREAREAEMIFQTLFDSTQRIQEIKSELALTEPGVSEFHAGDDPFLTSVNTVCEIANNPDPELELRKLHLSTKADVLDSKLQDTKNTSLMLQDLLRQAERSGFEIPDDMKIRSAVSSSADVNTVSSSGPGSRASSKESSNTSSTNTVISAMSSSRSNGVKNIQPVAPSSGNSTTNSAGTIQNTKRSKQNTTRPSAPFNAGRKLLSDANVSSRVADRESCSPQKKLGIHLDNCATGSQMSTRNQPTSNGTAKTALGAGGLLTASSGKGGSALGRRLARDIVTAMTEKAAAEAQIVAPGDIDVMGMSEYEDLNPALD